MNIFTTNYLGFNILYFSDIENINKIPMVWLRQDNDSYYICGSTFFLSAYLPESNNALKDINEALSLLCELAKITKSLDNKSKEKFGLLDRSGKEYSSNSFTKINELHNASKTV